MIKILLVEDDPHLRDILNRRLEKQGFEILTAKSGAQAIEVARQDSVDLILLDLRIPDIDGFAVLKAVRQVLNCLTLPVVAVTALDSEEIREQCQAAGFDDYLVKPIQFSTLLTRIQELTAPRLHQ